MCTHFWTFYGLILDYIDILLDIYILLDLYILELYTIIHLILLTLSLRINFKFKDLTFINFYRPAFGFIWIFYWNYKPNFTNFKIKKSG